MGNRNWLFIILLIVGAGIAVGIFFFYPKHKDTSALKMGSIKTEIVTKGAVVSSIKASGVVEPESEVLILSPARSIVKKVLKAPGSRVEKGEVIVLLDKENVVADIDRISDQLEMKRNSLDKTKLNAQSASLDLGYNEEVKKLRITSLKATLADQEQLFKAGGITQGRIDKTKQEILLAEKDLETLAEKNAIRLKQLSTNEKGLMLQIKAQEKSLTEKLELLAKLDIKAPSAGIVLDVAANEGVRVDVDKMLVRMSDLSALKVRAWVDEEFAKQLKTGNLVYVKLDNEKLQGTVGSITPIDEENRVQFDVYLKENNHPKLITGKSVEISIVTNQNTDVLRIKNSGELWKYKRQDVYVVKGNEAVKTEVILGTIGNEYCEIVSGLQEEDVVIVDDFNSNGLDRIKIRN